MLGDVSTEILLAEAGGRGVSVQVRVSGGLELRQILVR